MPTVVVVGLGPGGVEHVTDETRRLIDEIEPRFLRTARHPSAGLVTSAGSCSSFDELYESAARFADVYAEIVERLVAAAVAHERVLYAVPGSPLVLERSVALLRDDARVAVDVRPAMSFLDVAWARLGVDPVEAGVRLVDGHTFAASAAGEQGPLLVAHAHADWVLSEIKLAVDDPSVDDPSADDPRPDDPSARRGEPRVVVLQRLGTDDEQITEVAWSDLDREVVADHLTSLYIPRLGVPVAAGYARFHELVRTLRERCPWDREQTHRSLVPYLIEETFELVDALGALDPDDPATDEAVIEELGDVLYQLEFHAVVAEQEGRFSIADVTTTIHDKLVRRHPHVFGDVVADDPGTVVANWDAIKAAEKSDRTSRFDGVPTSLPALAYAQQLGRKAAKVGFDWPDAAGPLAKIGEEVDELRRAIDGDGDVEEELGDVAVAIVNVARHLGLDAEVATRRAAGKFRRRFEAMEQAAAGRGVDLASASSDTLEQWWDDAKRAER